jgi:HlyD family secretion protein
MLGVVRLLVAVLAVFALVGCKRGTAPNTLLGTLEWDRIGMPAEAAEPVIELPVVEGELVKTGTLLLSLDPRRTQSQLDGAQADVQRLSSALDELLHGARSETIDAVRADVARAESTAANARKERDRASEMRQKKLIAQADMDRAETTLRTATADANGARARLAELLHGTRPEDLAQAQAALATARANAEMLTIKRQRLDLQAPRDGRIDALPYKLGDQPPLGASVLSMLVGDAPYARVYVPEAKRTSVKPGTRFRVHVDGIAQPFDATLRSIRAEASFTPYYALQGDDASRLSYRAELLLTGEAARQLPAGVPVQAEIVGDEQHK